MDIAPFEGLNWQVRDVGHPIEGNRPLIRPTDGQTPPAVHRIESELQAKCVQGQPVEFLRCQVPTGPHGRFDAVAQVSCGVPPIFWIPLAYAALHRPQIAA